MRLLGGKRVIENSGFVWKLGFNLNLKICVKGLSTPRQRPWLINFYLKSDKNSDNPYKLDSDPRLLVR